MMEEFLDEDDLVDGLRGCINIIYNELSKWYMNISNLILFDLLFSIFKFWLAPSSKY